jgi:hypothetical protein
LPIVSLINVIVIKLLIDYYKIILQMSLLVVSLDKIISLNYNLVDKMVIISRYSDITIW